MTSDSILDLWRTARPSLESWMRDRAGLRSVWRSARQSLPHWLERLPQLPGMAFDLLAQLKDGRLEVATRDQALQEIRREIREVHRRLVYAVAGVGLVLAAGLLSGAARATTTIPFLGWLFGGFGIGALVAAFMPRFRA